MNDQLGLVRSTYRLERRGKHLPSHSWAESFPAFRRPYSEPSGGVEATKWMDGNLRATKRHGQISEPAFDESAPRRCRRSLRNMERSALRSDRGFRRLYPPPSRSRVLRSSMGPLRKKLLFCWTPRRRKCELRALGRESREGFALTSHALLTLPVDFDDQQ